METEKTTVLEPDKTQKDAPKNALSIFDDNQRRIMDRDGSKVYPITVPLRKKLEALKEESIGDLRTQLRFIKDEKHKEFEKSKETEMKRLKKAIGTKAKNLSETAYKVMQRKRKEDAKISMRYIEEAKKFYKQVDALMNEYPELITKFEEYDFPLAKHREGDYKPPTNWEMQKQDEEDKSTFKLTLNESAFNKQTKKEFNEKYGEAFDEAEKKISDISRQFQESLLFGDMEVAKRVYYTLKQADSFLEKLRNFKVN